MVQVTFKKHKTTKLFACGTQVSEILEMMSMEPSENTEYIKVVRGKDTNDSLGLLKEVEIKGRILRQLFLQIEVNEAWEKIVGTAQTLGEILKETELMMVGGDLKERQSIYEMRFLMEIAAKKKVPILAFILMPKEEKEISLQMRYDLEELQKKADTLLLMEGEKIQELFMNIYPEQDFSYFAESFLLHQIQGLVQLIEDFQYKKKDKELLQILKGNQRARMVVIEVKDTQNADQAIKLLIENPIWGIKKEKMKGGILTLSMGRKLARRKINAIVSALQAYFSEEISILYTVRLEKEREEKIQAVFLILE